jgi:hypothetical protein
MQVRQAQDQQCHRDPAAKRPLASSTPPPKGNQ